MRPEIRSFSLLWVVLALAACGSSPPVRYFTLQAPAIDYHQDAPGTPALSLGPLRLPEYLDRSQMVRRGAGAEIVVDGQSRWAEPLDQAVHRVVARTVDGLADALIVVAYPTTSMIDPDYRLVGSIYRFDADAQGLAVFEIQWAVADAESNPLISARRSRYTKQAASAGDPGALATALSDTLEQYGRDVAREMNAALATADGE